MKDCLWASVHGSSVSRLLSTATSLSRYFPVAPVFYTSSCMQVDSYEHAESIRLIGSSDSTSSGIIGRGIREACVKTKKYYVNKYNDQKC